MASKSAQRLFFCHIPKTGGLTLRSLLSEHFHEREICPYGQGSDIPPDIPQSKLQSYRLYMGHFPLSMGETLLGRPFSTITMLRDPVDRVLSAYDHIRRNPHHPRHQIIGGADATLEDYIKLDPYSSHSNAQVLFLSAISQTPITIESASQFYLEVLRNVSKASVSLERAKEMLEQIDFFGITERHDDSIRMLYHRFGWAPPGSYENINVGHGRKRSSDFPQQQMDWLAEANQLDTELYNFGRQLFETRYREFTARLEWNSYRFRTQQWERPTEAMISVEDAHEGHGWYPRECNSQGVYYRWSGPGTKSVFYTRVAPATRMELSVGVGFALIPATLDALKIRINGTDVAFHRSYDPQHAMNILRGEFDGALVDTRDGVTAIEFIVPGTISPNELDSTDGDTRKLGFACCWVNIRPKYPAAS